jgi:RNA polymerase sigma-70 factor (ECF subfamily)
VRFYPWLRQIAWERLIELQRMHVKAQCRSVRREQELDAVMSHESADFLAEQLAASNTGPLQKLARKELNERVRQAIERLSPPLREALLVRYLEQLSAKDAADLLGISPATFKQRLLRALRQLREYLSSDREDLP